MEQENNAGGNGSLEVAKPDDVKGALVLAVEGVLGPVVQRMDRRLSKVEKRVGVMVKRARRAKAVAETVAAGPLPVLTIMAVRENDLPGRRIGLFVVPPNSLAVVEGDIFEIRRAGVRTIGEFVVRETPLYPGGPALGVSLKVALQIGDELHFKKGAM